MDEMAKPHGLNQRDKVWYYRARIPKDLVQRYGRKEIWISLKTQDYKKALELFHLEALKLQAEYAEFRRRRSLLQQAGLAPTRDFEIEREEAQALVRAYLAERLTSTESCKTARDYGGSSDEIRIELSGSIGELLDPNDNPHARNLVIREANSLLRRRGYPIKDDQWPSQGFLDLVRRALVASLAVEWQRLDGDFSDNPRDALFENFREAEYPPVLSGSNKITVHQGITKFWKDELSVDPKRAKTEAKYRASLDLLTRYLGADTLLRSVTRDKLLAYRDLLSRIPPNFTKRFDDGLTLEALGDEAERLGLAPMKYKTQEMYISLMVRFFRWATKDDYIRKNISLDIRPRAKRVPDAAKRRSFTIAELNQIFQAPLFTGCQNDQHGYARPGLTVTRRSRFWGPLIAIHTGMRMGEILQLTTDSIRRSPSGTNFFYLSETEDDGDKDFERSELKNFASRREVPIHSALVKAGFLGFVADARKRKQVLLFPEANKAADGKRSTIYSKWFSRFLHKTGVKPDGSGNCFHMFRHTLRDALRRGGVQEEMADAIQGWSRDHSTGRTYGEGFEADTLLAELEKLSLPGLDIEHLFARDS